MLSILRSTLSLFLPTCAVPPTQRPLNLVVHMRKSIHLAFHIEVHFKPYFCERALSPYSKTLEPHRFHTEIHMYTVLPIMRSTSSLVSANAATPPTQRHLNHIVFYKEIVHFVVHIEVHFNSYFCERALSLVPKDT